MERASHGTVLVVPERASARWRDTELAIAGFLAMYREQTRKGHATELRLWRAWCAEHDLDMLDDVERAHIYMYARELEEIHERKKSTIAHKLSVLAGFYDYCADEELLPGKNPARKLRRPKIEYITTREHLDDGELRRFLAKAAESKHPRDVALCRLLACNGLRISEALNANVEDFAYEGHHRTLRITRKGGKIRRIPVSPFVSVAIDRYLDGRTAGPIFLGREGHRMDRHAASRIVKRICKQIGVGKSISPHCLRHSAITSLLNAGVPLRDVQHFADHSDPRTTSYYDHGRKSLDSNPTYILATFVAGG